MANLAGQLIRSSATYQQMSTIGTVMGEGITDSLKALGDGAGVYSIIKVSTTSAEIGGTGVSTFALNNGGFKVSFDYSSITGSDKTITIQNANGILALQAAALTGGSVLFANSSGIITQDNANFFWDDTNNFLGLGNAAPISELHVYSTSTAANRGITFEQASSDALGARINLLKRRSGIITTADVLGRVTAWGYDGANYLLMGQISFNSEGTIASTRVPTNMTFSTATDAAPSVLTEAMRINSSQFVGIGQTNPTQKVHITDARTTNGSAGIFLQKTGTVSGSTSYGIYSDVSGSSLLNCAGYFQATNATTNVAIMAVGRSTFGSNSNPTAWVLISAGTATAGFAPLKFTSGTNLTTAEAGAMEYDGTNLLFTKTGTTRGNVLVATAVTTEVVVSDTTLTITYNGTTYKVLIKA